MSPVPSSHSTHNMAPTTGFTPVQVGQRIEDMMRAQEQRLEEMMNGDDERSISCHVAVNRTSSRLPPMGPQGPPGVGNGNTNGTAS
jgi:hypothetical protein